MIRLHNAKWFIYFSFVIYICMNYFELSFNYLICFSLTNLYYTLGEYIFHRFTFHNKLTFPKITKLHYKHHEEPTNKNRLFIPIHITMINDILLCSITYVLNLPWKLLLSSAHLSYLLFELAHYGTHSKVVRYLLPSRLISFHEHHHYDDTLNFGFTTPAWDIYFNTAAKQFTFKDYPLYYLPISIISFISTKELLVITNFIYIYPAYNCLDKQWYFLSIFYFLVSFISTTYHYISNTSRYYKLIKQIDYIFALFYFFISLHIYIHNANLAIEPIFWCISSLIIMKADWTYNNKLIHVLWHLFTGLGVGRMIGNIN